LETQFLAKLLLCVKQRFISYRISKQSLETSSGISILRIQFFAHAVLDVVVDACPERSRRNEI
jgi:hypothetical protein